MKNQIGQVALWQPGDQACGGLAFVRGKTQIERALAIKTESAVLVGQLVARQAQIEQHGIDRLDFQLVQHLRQLAEIGLGNFYR